VTDWFASPIEGGDGNREFFIRAARVPGAAPVPATAPKRAARKATSP